MNRVSQIQFWDAQIFVVRTFRCTNFRDALKFVHLKKYIWRSLPHKFVHHKSVWTQLNIVHCQGPCSLRPWISRPYCNLFRMCFVFKMNMITHSSFSSISKLLSTSWLRIRQLYSTVTHGLYMWNITQNQMKSRWIDFW